MSGLGGGGKQNGGERMKGGNNISESPNIPSWFLETNHTELSHNEIPLQPATTKLFDPSLLYPCRHETE